ncbi:MAG TPA: thermonuclease family protein [Candidatus Omnitrophota bacterium]|nr:thermonuclease family protein [Candidatus Omnitrophota bacterium]
MLNLFLFVLVFAFIPFAVWGQPVDDLINFSKKQEDGLIVKVVNTDMVVLENGHRLKLIGIESAGLPPRKYVQLDKNGIPIEEKEEATIPLEEQALTYAQEIMEGKKVKIEYDIESVDPEGRRFAYVHLSDGRMANTELLRQGFVYLKIRPPNIKHAAELRAAYQEAKREQRGFLGD